MSAPGTSPGARSGARSGAGFALLVLGVAGLIACLALVFWLSAGGAGWVAAEARLVQRDLVQQMSAAVQALTSEPGWSAWLGLIGVGFTYGVLHAAGPGHGKAVIGAYAVSQRVGRRRVVAVAAAAALVQALSAIVLVAALALLVDGALGRVARQSERWLEVFSAAAIALVGLYLMAAAMRSLWRLRRPAGIDHAHHAHHAHDPHHAGHDCCGHDHMPSPDRIAALNGWRDGALLALAVGARPCGGAVLLLVLAFALGVPAGGIAGVLAMSVGTAATVSTLVLIAGSARRPLVALIERAGSGARPVTASLSAVALLGGAAIAGVGATLAHSLLTAPAPHPIL